MALNAAIIEDVANEIGGEFETDYSGRSMYGSTCCAIYADNGYDYTIAEAIANALAYDEGDDEEFEDDRYKGGLNVPHRSSISRF